MERYAEEERQIRQENVRLQRKLQMEIERREQMCRRLSESESSIEMDEERYAERLVCFCYICRSYYQKLHVFFWLGHSIIKVLHTTTTTHA